MKLKLSIVIPVFNESKNIGPLVQRLTKTLDKITRSYEIIFVNDGSIDDSLKEIKRVKRGNKKIKYISFSRNFGHMASLDAGLAHCSGKAVVIMDADLQDPPEVILKMYSQYLRGWDVVYGVKTKRKEGLLRNLLFKTFYRILNKISSYEMPLDTGTFSLMDEKVVKVLRELPERNKYLSGLRAWVGFRQTGVVYPRGKRLTGKPASYLRLLSLAMNGFISFSYIPLRISSYLGFVFAGFSFIMIILIILAKLFLGIGIIGWASTISTLLLIGGVQLITLGIIGEYLARIYDEVKNRPEYIISDKVGFNKNAKRTS